MGILKAAVFSFFLFKVSILEQFLWLIWDVCASYLSVQYVHQAVPKTTKGKSPPRFGQWTTLHHYSKHPIGGQIPIKL